MVYRCTTMLIFCVMLLAVVLPGAAKRKLYIRKCCGRFQMLSADGRACVDAPWPRNQTFQEFSKYNTYTFELQPENAPWLNQWFPPGVPIERVGDVEENVMKDLSPGPLRRPADTSVEWDERQAEAEGATYWRNRVVFSEREWILRIEAEDINQDVLYGQTNHMRTSSYCLDATQNHLMPFVLLLQRNGNIDECIQKCCYAKFVMVEEEDGWKCGEDARGPWSRENSSFARFLPLELPVFDWDYIACTDTPRQTLRPEPGSAGVAYLLRRRYHQFLFYTWRTCVDNERRQDGSFGETIFYCHYSRITRGIYWLLRPLSFVAVALLVVALLSIACNSGLRRKAHGWCLACHGACLLAYNVGQVVYYLTISDQIDTFNYVPPHLMGTCHKLALSTYFLLAAANSWLTALCFNMVLGFRKLRVVHSDGSQVWRRFLALSIFAWGLPALMTGLCAYAFEKNHLLRKWYSPSLSETRTCYNEMASEKSEDSVGRLDSYTKYGTAFFFYAPASVLVVVNCVCITRTLKSIQFLRRGNSVLHREEDKASRGLRQKDGANPWVTDSRSREAAHTTLPDAKTIRLYVKMLLMTGIVEMFTETIVWTTTAFSEGEKFSLADHALSYRATGYAADCFRAACVAWLAAPDGGYFAVLRWRPGGGQRARAGSAARKGDRGNR